MKNIRMLKAVDVFKFFFNMLGVDYPVMRRILEVKLTMDARRTPVMMQNSARRKANKDKNQFLRSLWFYGILGLMSLVFILMDGPSYQFQMTMAFTIYMFIIMTSMISDFSSVLLDIRDKAILGTKPVTQRTMNAAKTMHVIIYMFFLTGATVAVPLVVSLFIHGPLFFLLFLAEIILVNFLIIFITAILYFLILQFFDGEKVKDFINYVQIGLSIIVAVSYQFVARAFDLTDLHITLHQAWWQFLLPPFWYGAPFDMVLHSKTGAFLTVLTALALLVPILSLIIYIKMMPAFEKSLEKLEERRVEGKKPRKQGLLTRLICPGPQERAYYRFAGFMMRSERDFKLKVYPSLGFAIILPFVFLFNAFRNYSLTGIETTKWYLIAYMSLIVIPTCVVMLVHSGKYKGAWLFRTVPVTDPSPIFKGTLKAFFVKLFLPVFLLDAVAFTYLFKWHVIPSLLVIGCSAFLYLYICYRVFVRALPFSKPFDSESQNMGMKVLPMLLVVGIFVVLHFTATMIPYGIYIYLILLIVANLIVWTKTFKASWSAVI